MTPLVRFLVPVVVLVFASAPVLGQNPSARRAGAAVAATPAAQSGEGWRISPPSVDVASEYVDNVFLLKDGRRDDLDPPSAGDALSGRYADMRSASDVVTSLAAEVAVKGPGVFGRTLTISPSLRYARYATNTRRSNATLGIDVEQSLARGGELRVRGRLTPSYFAKNYLADAIDADASGTIDDAERIYRRGTYGETELSVDYRHRFRKSTRRSPLGAAVRLGGGYYSRRYEAPFSGRDLSGPTTTISLLTRLTRRLELDLAYAFASLGATPADEVLLLDEPEMGVDLNGNGTTTDLNVRSVQTVDRSRHENVLGASVHLELSRITDIELEYEHRWRGYGSKQPLDVAFNGRSAGRDVVAGEVRFRLARGVRLAVGGSIAAQHLSRANDFGNTGEVGDYAKRTFSAKLGYSF